MAKLRIYSFVSDHCCKFLFIIFHRLFMIFVAGSIMWVVPRYSAWSSGERSRGGLRSPLDHADPPSSTESEGPHRLPMQKSGGEGMVPASKKKNENVRDVPHSIELQQRSASLRIGWGEEPANPRTAAQKKRDKKKRKKFTTEVTALTGAGEQEAGHNYNTKIAPSGFRVTAEDHDESRAERRGLSASTPAMSTKEGQQGSRLSAKVSPQQDDVGAPATGSRYVPAPVASSSYSTTPWEREHNKAPPRSTPVGLVSSPPAPKQERPRGRKNGGLIFDSEQRIFTASSQSLVSGGSSSAGAGAQAQLAGGSSGATQHVEHAPSRTSVGGRPREDRASQQLLQRIAQLNRSTRVEQEPGSAGSTEPRASEATTSKITANSYPANPDSRAPISYPTPTNFAETRQNVATSSPQAFSHLTRPNVGTSSPQAPVQVFGDERPSGPRSASPSRPGGSRRKKRDRTLAEQLAEDIDEQMRGSRTDGCAGKGQKNGATSGTTHIRRP